MTALRPDAAAFSPALGLLLHSSPVFLGNLLQSSAAPPGGDGAGPLYRVGQLSRQLFYQRSAAEPATATRSRSNPASYLTPELTAHLLGLALSDEPDGGIDDRLRFLGVECNRIGGVPTGVSLARFRRLIHGIRDAWAEAGGEVAAALLLALVWERASTKQCLLNFLLTLHEYRPVLAQPSTFQCPSDRQFWLEAQFYLEDYTDAVGLEAASQRVLSAASSREGAMGVDWAEGVELLVFGLSLGHAFKPAVPAGRFRYRGLEAKPDCVEAALRETFDLLLFDPVQQRFDPSRLPPSSTPELVGFYTRGANIDSANAGQQWFNLCSDLPEATYLA
eukprot:gene6211-7443_t